MCCVCLLCCVVCIFNVLCFVLCICIYCVTFVYPALCLCLLCCVCLLICVWHAWQGRGSLGRGEYNHCSKTKWSTFGYWLKPTYGTSAAIVAVLVWASDGCRHKQRPGSGVSGPSGHGIMALSGDLHHVAVEGTRPPGGEVAGSPSGTRC